MPGGSAFEQTVTIPYLLVVSKRVFLQDIWRNDFFFYHKGLKLKCPCFNNLCGWRLVVGSWNLEGLIYTFETTREGILDLKLSRRFGAGPRGKSERKWNPTKAYKSNKTWCKFIELLWLSRWGWFWAPVPKVFVMFTKRKHPAKQENRENCSKLAWLSLTYLTGWDESERRL